MRLKISNNLLKDTLPALLAAAALGLSVAGGVSCTGNGEGGGYRGRGGGEEAPAVEASPLADTVALVEGLHLFENGEYELAREQLSVSARSGSTYIRAESFLYLNALEMELGNYDTAHSHLERYHAETVRLLRSAADSSKRMEEQAARLNRRQDVLVGGVIIAGLISLGAVVLLARRREVGASGRREGTEQKSAQPAATVDTAEWERWLTSAGEFKQRAIYAEIASLAGQKPGREAKVLPSARQEVLDGELAEVFSDFAATICGDYPTLTGGDVKLCCLSLLPLSPFGRALCFGSTETNIVKQRKHTIKKKLGADGRGQALFGFIFEARG